MRKILIALAVVGGAAFTGAQASSSACGTGQVPAGTTPVGIGVAAGTSGVTACNNGAVVPSPAKGSATVHVGSGSGYVEADGDSDNTASPCTDGFTRVAVSGSGPAFYESPNGNYTDTDPNTDGNQTAQPQSPQSWAQNTANNCH
jgi:hypothetical protein